MSDSVSLNDFMPLATKAPGRGKYLAFGMTLAVHLALLVLLVFGVRWTTRTNAAVAVDLVSMAEPLTTVATEVKPPSLPLAPLPVQKVAPELETRPVSQIAKPEIVLKEDRAAKEKPRPVLSAPLPDSSDRLLQKQLEQELKRTRAERQQAHFSNAADQELERLRVGQAENARSKATKNYIARIQSRIRSNIVLPHDLNGNPEAIFDVTQFPSGEILDVKLKRSSGNGAYDAAVERAIWKSSPLPKPERSDIFSRELELKFRPLED
jgi:colicin import membrane protein